LSVVAVSCLPLHSGRASGPDGIPVEFWRVGRGTWAPLLARLFSAMAACHTLPEDFTLVRVVPLPKGGLASCPGRYRPITLLNADCKLLARILATRLGMHSSSALGHIRLRSYRDRRLGTASLLQHRETVLLVSHPGGCWVQTTHAAVGPATAQRHSCVHRR
jgi:hypothetical protein